MPGDSASLPGPPAGTWRVVTWNIWWHFGPEPEGRYEAIRATLGNVDADIVCLQEVFTDRQGVNDAERLAGALGLRVVRTVSRSNGEQSLGNAILSRWPVIEGGERPLPDASGVAGSRTALWAVLRAPFGPSPVISTHLNYRFDESAVRQEQLRSVVTLAADLRSGIPESPPVLLCGDLNAVPDSDEIRLITGRSAPPVPGLVFNDCWPQVRDDPGHTWVRHNPYLADSVWPGRRLDYVMVSWPRPAPLANPVQAFVLGDGPVDGIWPSDHLGVAVDLRQPG